MDHADHGHQPQSVSALIGFPSPIWMKGRWDYHDPDKYASPARFFLMEGAGLSILTLPFVLLPLLLLLLIPLHSLLALRGAFL